MILHVFFLVNLAALINSKNTERVPTGAVVTNGQTCAEIGASILEKGGTAVDAAIASLFCEGISVPNCMGLGGGFLMSIYVKDQGKVVSLNSREVAPAEATEDMFGSDENLAIRGGLAVAVPAELKGYWAAYNKYGGKVAWKDLVQPTIDLCKNGILVTEYLANLYSSQTDVIMNDEILRETFIDPTTNKTYVQNDRVKRPRLAKTLELIAEVGADALYNGNLTKQFVQDIQDKGGIITADDLLNYKPEWKEPVQIKLPFDQVLYAPPLPGSGLILGFIINILNDFLDNSQPSLVSNWERIVESFKFGFAKRTELGDPDFVDIDDIIANLTSVDFAKSIRGTISDDHTFQDPTHYGAETVTPEDHGTANLCVMAPNGDAVVVTSTINLDFGAGFMSASTGIILNDQMDDFSSPDFINNYGVPPSPPNYIHPGKRPVSSMSPSIVIGKDGDVRLIVGGSGGTRIITSVVLTMIKNLWFNVTIEEAVADKRLHHQLFPMVLSFEAGYDMDLVNALAKIGHEYEIAAPSNGFNTITSISRENGILKATFDKRRGGETVFIYSNNSSSAPSSSTLIKPVLSSFVFPIVPVLSMFVPLFFNFIFNIIHSS